MKYIAWEIRVLFCAGIILLTGCGGGGGSDDDARPAPPSSTPTTPTTPTTPAPQAHTVNGAATGLSNNSQLILRNNGGDALTIANSGEFSFATAVVEGSAYNVTIAAQPAGKICTVSYGSGTIVSSAIRNVAIACTNSSGAVDPQGPNTLSSTRKPTLVGIVIEGRPVSNLRYDGPGAVDGTTNAAGQFNYQPGESITFKVGDIALPPVIGKPVITPIDFAGTNDTSNPKLVNTTRFLQSIDSDGNPDNGIAISEEAHTAATGKALDFGSTSFDADANPIVAAAGGAHASLVSGAAAIAHLETTLDNLPKLIPIAGAWITGSGVNTRAVILLENGMYYGIDGNCSGKPGYEFGAWAFSNGTLTLAVSADANGSCGLDTGSHAATLSGNSLTLDGATWTDLSYATTGLSGFYSSKSYIGGAEEAHFFLFTDTQYLYFEIEEGKSFAEIGTYTWGGNSNPALTLNPPKSAGTPNVQNELTHLLFTEAGGQDMYMAVRPARVATTLPGIWAMDDDGDITTPGANLAYPMIFTANGKYMYLGNDPACPGIARAASGEIGTYTWDAVTSAFSLTITGDSNGECGLANEVLTASSSTSATVTGNLLNFDTSDGSGTYVKPSLPTLFAFPYQNNTAGIWKQTSGSGALTLLISQANASTLHIKALDSNCPSTGTSYAIESLDATVGSPNTITQAAAPTNYDTVACGLPSTLGPTYSIVGDTLSIDGIGSFIRQ